MTWATNWDSSAGKGKLLKIALNDLRGALGERTDVVDRSIPGSVVTIASNDLVYSSWFGAFQGEITALIPLYLNHTDNGGSWDGQGTIPAWDEASILTAIGAASRLSAPNDPLVSAAWMYQQYEIINLLRWIDLAAVSNTPRQRRGTGATWAAAKTSFDGAAWTGAGGRFHFYGRESVTGSFDIEMDDAYIRYTSPGTSLQHSLDLYGYLTNPAGFYDNWFDVDDLVGEDTWNILFTESERASGSTVYTTATYVYATRSWTYPPEPSDDSYYNGTSNNDSTAYKAVLKFDGANGFTYKDW